MADLRRGDFNKRVMLSNPVKTPDGAGGFTELYVAFLTTWASVQTKGGSRVFQSAEDQLIDRKVISIYYRKEVEAKINIDTRVTYEGQEYGLSALPALIDEDKHIYQLEMVGR